MIGPLCTPYSICLSIVFWQSSFVWKRWVFNLNTFNCIPISLTEGCFKNPYHHFLEEAMLFLITLRWNLKKKRFPMLRQKSTQILLKPCCNVERNNLSFLPIWWITFFKSLYSLIDSIEINWLCKHGKKVRISQFSISISSCTESSKTVSPGVSLRESDAPARYLLIELHG